MEGGKKIESATLSVVHILLHERSICAVWECCAAGGVVKTRERASGKKRCGVSMRQYGEEDP